MDSNEGLITKSGMFHPKGFVVAAVPPPTDAASVGQTLRDAGFTDVRVFTSQEILEDIKRIESKQGFFDRLAMSLAEEGAPREMYLERIKQGAAIVLARANSDEEITSAHMIMKTNGGQSMVYYGDTTFRELR